MIEVWDTGIGIDAANSEDIFREFFQIGNHARNSDSGLGLGLSICRRISTLLDFDISVSSKPGRGSVFRIRLPLVSDVSGSITDSKFVVDELETGTELQDLRVLIIDDDLVGLSALSVVLESFGMETVLAQSSQRANELLADGERIDLVVSDFRLSEQMNGIEFIKSIRKLPNYSAVPALIVTGDTAPAVLTHIESSGIPYTHKPVQPPLLAAELTRLVTVSG